MSSWKPYIFGKLLREPHDFFGFQTQSVDLFKSYNAAKQPVELHIYEKGNHGFGMKKQNLPSDEWINTFKNWLDSHNFSKK